MPKTISIQKLQETLRTKHQKGDAWAQMGREYDLNPATLWRIVNQDYEPRRDDIRRKLNLHEIITQEVGRDAKGRFISRG